MIHEMVTKYKSYMDIVALMTGTLLHFLTSKEKITFRFTLVLIISSIATALFVITPIVQYLDLNDTNIGISLQALGGILSIQIISFITSVLPQAGRDKFLLYLGLDLDRYDRDDLNNDSEKEDGKKENCDRGEN